MTDEPQLPMTLPLRQRQVLVGLAQDKSTKEIAYQHHISVRTVRAYTATLKEKLNCYKLTGLVAEAIRLQLITPVETEAGIEWKARV